MKLTDEELIAAIESEESLTHDEHAGQLQQERADALDRYKGALLGNEEEGRSAVVDRTILDTIEWIMPSLIRIYLGGDELGKFAATGPEDEQAAEMETEICNWYLTEKNDYFSQISAILKDALLLKNGYGVAYWNTRNDTMTETYQGLADEELAMLMQDQEVTVVEHTERPDPVSGAMLHDVKVEMKKSDEYVSVESIAPDEIKVSRRHRWTSLIDADFVQWQRRITIGQARAEGFDIPDDAPGYEDTRVESVARERFIDLTDLQDQTADPSRKLILLKDTYIRIDLRGKGTPQLWRVVYVRGATKPVLKEEADIIPFAAFSPIIYPHSHIGMSVYDLIADLGIIKTTLLRQYLDGVYLANSQQYVVDVNRVNIDDFLVSRPGGIKRVEGEVMGAVMPLPSNDVGQVALGGLEYLDSVKEARTGVTRYSAGLDANTLNKTATGVQAIQSAANQRIELIARTLASGFRDLMLVIHTLVCKHSTKPIQVKLKGQWQAIDPRTWRKRTDFQITVGLGTGNPEQQMAKLQAIAQFMAQGAQMGLCGPEEFYNWGREFLKAAGYKNSNKFIHDPPKDQNGNVIPPQPPPNPLVEAEKAKAQAQLPIKQIEVQAESAQKEADRNFELAKLKMQLDSNERIAAMNNAAKTDLELAKMAEERALQLHVADRESQHKDKALELERSRLQMDAMNHASDRADRAKPPKEEDGGKVTDALAQTVAALHQSVTAPREAVRDASGRLIGVRVAQ